jgi:hypothetical protein
VQAEEKTFPHDTEEYKGVVEEWSETDIVFEM